MGNIIRELLLMERFQSWWVGLFVVTLLLIQTGMLAHSATVNSPTMLEPAFLVAGLSHWEHGDFVLYRVNPPLIRSLAALPTYLYGYESDWSRYDKGPGTRAVFSLAKDFTARNENIQSFIIWGRWTCIPLLIIGSLLVFHWSSKIFNSSLAGLLSQFLWTFNPWIIGHGVLITPDVSVAVLILLAAYLFVQWVETPSWRWATLAGISLGIAQLAKFTALLLFPFWLSYWIFIVFFSHLSCDRKNNLRTQSSQLAGIFVLAFFVLNAGYFFQGTFRELGDYEFVSASLNGNSKENSGNRFRSSLLGKLPVPLPEQMLIGLDIQKRDLESFSNPSYLNGKWRQGGWWYYYLYSLLVKTPVSTSIIFIISLACLTGRQVQKTAKHTCMILLLLSITILVVVSSHTVFNHHGRYIMPVFGFLTVISGGAVFFSLGWFHWKRTLGHGTIIALLLATTISFLSHYPYEISFMNWASGTSSHGWKYFLHSNYDWGQDLLRLKKWLDEQGIDNIRVIEETNRYEIYQVLKIPHTANSPICAISANCLLQLPNGKLFAEKKTNLRVGDNFWIIHKDVLANLSKDGHLYD